MRLKMGSKIIVKKSIICVSLGEDDLRRVLDEFDISDKTPLECMDFLRRLKEVKNGAKK